MAKAEPKTYIVTWKGDRLEIQTDYTKPRTLETLLFLIYREFNNINPDKLQAFMDRANRDHERIKNKLKPPEEPEPELEEGWDFWNALIQRIREP